MSQLIIEFNGLPGAGKTTICNNVKKQLKENGISYADFYTYEHQKKRTFFSMLNLVLCGILNGNAKTIFQYIKLGISIGNKQNIRVIISALRNALLLRMYSKKSTADILIADQCIVQDLLSCFYCNSLSLKSEINILEISKLFNDIVLINVSLDCGTSMERIRYRKNGESRLDKMNDEQVHRALKIQKENLNRIRSLFNNTSIEINASKSIMTSSQEIVNEIVKGKLKKEWQKMTD